MVDSTRIPLIKGLGEKIAAIILKMSDELVTTDPESSSLSKHEQELVVQVALMKAVTKSWSVCNSGACKASTLTHMVAATQVFVDEFQKVISLEKLPENVIVFPGGHTQH